MKENQGIENIKELVGSGDFIIKSTFEWYFPDGVPSMHRAKALWAELLNHLAKRGKQV